MTDRPEFETLAEEKYGDKFTSLTDDAVDDLYERFEKKFDTFGDEKLALTAAVGSFNFDENMEGSSAQTDLVDVIGLGFNGPRPFGDTDTLFCYGIALPDDGKAGRIVILVDEADVEQSLDDFTDYFSPYEPITAEISLRESSAVNGVHAGSAAYIGEVEHADPFEIRDSERTEEEREEIAKDHTEELSISEISDHLTIRGDNGYPSGFGVDFKRLDNAVTLNANITGKGARYVLQDDSFLDPEELSPEVRGEDNDIGLVTWTEPANATFDQESIVDVYGTVTPGGDGHITMRMYGSTAATEGSVIEAETPQESSDSGSSSSDSSGSDSGQASSEPVESRSI